MRILKGKIARALEAKKADLLLLTTQEKQVEVPKTELSVFTREERPKRTRQKQEVSSSSSPTLSSPVVPKGSTSAKNIMKNYSRALVNFALSSLALPYLTKILKSLDVTLEQFKEFIQTYRGKVNCIKNLRQLLLYEENDPEEVRAIKNGFKQISVIFIKFFSVNWIFQSKIYDRKTHLKYRFKILRRINDPMHFTYLEEFSK